MRKILELKRWREALTLDPELSSALLDEKHDNPAIAGAEFWEFKTICRALRRKKLLEFVKLKPREAPWLCRVVLDRLTAELENYRTSMGALLQANESSRNLKRVLKQIQRTLRKAHAEVLPKERESITRYLNSIELDLEELERVHPILDGSGVVGQLMASDHAPRKINRKLELDGQFQLRIARLFRFFLTKKEGVSVRVISGLVVLFYMCCGLASDQNGQLTSFCSRQTLNVASMEQKLSRGGLT